MKSKANIERKESKMSTNNDEDKVSRTFDGTQKAFQAFITWLKGILMYKGIVHITQATIKCLLPKQKWQHGKLSRNI